MWLGPRQPRGFLVPMPLVSGGRVRKMAACEGEGRAVLPCSDLAVPWLDRILDLDQLISSIN
jgi:hypothetical protein